MKKKAFDRPKLFINRELSWLAFNNRVLQQGQNKSLPLAERLKFMAIVSSNLDEFFMKRIGGLKQQLGAGFYDRTVDGRTPEEQIGECYAFIRRFQKDAQELIDRYFAAYPGVRAYLDRTIEVGPVVDADQELLADHARGRFVQEQQIRILHQCPGDGNPLLLAAGKLRGQPVQHGLQVQQLCRFPDLCLNLIGRYP